MEIKTIADKLELGYIFDDIRRINKILDYTSTFPVLIRDFEEPILDGKGANKYTIERSCTLFLCNKCNFDFKGSEVETIVEDMIDLWFQVRSELEKTYDVSPANIAPFVNKFDINMAGIFIQVRVKEKRGCM